MTTTTTDTEPDYEALAAEARAENMATQARDLVADMRACADWLERHPDAAARVHPPMLYLFNYSEESWQATLKAIGSFRKSSTSSYLNAEVKFGQVTVQATISHEQVCEKKVVGTREVERPVLPPGVEMLTETVTEDITEWVCPPSWMA